MKQHLAEMAGMYERAAEWHALEAGFAVLEGDLEAAAAHAEDVKAYRRASKEIGDALKASADGVSA